MELVSFGKRLALALIVCIPLVLIFSYVIFQVLTFYTFGVVSFIFGVILIIFGACLRTPFVEGMATIRYAVNPQQTRDTMRHFSERREEQSESSVIILIVGAIMLILGLISLAVVPFFPL